MISITSFMLLAIPIGLVIAARALIRGRGNPDTAGRRFFLFLTWTSVGLLAAIFITNWLTLWPGFGFVSLLAPVTTGVIAMSFLHLHEWRTLHSREKALVLLALILLTILLVVRFWAGSVKGDWSQPETIFLGLAIFSISVFLSIVWTIGKRIPALPGVVALLCLASFNALEMGALPLPAESSPVWLSVLSVVAYVALPGLVIATAAMLTSKALKALPSSGESGSISWRPTIGRLVLVVILLGYLVYTFVWLWIWDGTDDGVRGFAMLTVSSIAAIAAGMVIGLTSTGWRAWIGLALQFWWSPRFLGQPLVLGTGSTPMRLPKHVPRASRKRSNVIGRRRGDIPLNWKR